MKTTPIILLLTLLSISCSDDNVTPAGKESALVTRISSDGLTSLELLYDLTKRLVRINQYNKGNYNSYSFYEYTEDGLKERRRYDADDNNLNYRTVFTLDNAGRVIKQENYTKPDFFDDHISTVEYQYNSSGQLSTRNSTSSGLGISFRDEFAYDDKGNLLTIKRRFYPDEEGEFVGNQSDYTPGALSIPEEWKPYAFVLGTSGVDDDITNMFITDFHNKSWNSSGVLVSETSLETSGQEFDDDGNLIHQVTTAKNILKPENADVVHDMTYEYKKEN